MKDTFFISKIKVKAPISHKKVETDGEMPMPNSPDDIAYYDFSFFPGLGGQIGEFGNSIFSGHVDSGFDYCDFGKTPPPCNAVLWDLDKLKHGDRIDIVYKNNKFTYKVAWNKKVFPTGKTWSRIFKSGNQESITIFTCAGNFDEKSHTYNMRQVVLAMRVG